MTTPQPRPAGLEALRPVVPKLIELRDSVLFGDIWQRPELSPRDRSMITVAVLTALYRPDELRGHIGRALDNGVTPEEIAEIITHVAFYGGMPTGMLGGRTAREVFEARGLLKDASGGEA